jgi:hypothetical protein
MKIFFMITAAITMLLVLNKQWAFVQNETLLACEQAVLFERPAFSLSTIHRLEKENRRKKASSNQLGQNNMT